MTTQKTASGLDADDLAPDIDTDLRNSELDADLLKGGESVAGLRLRPISAGDLAILMQGGVGIVVGKTDAISYDTGAILWAQSTDRSVVRQAFAEGKFRERVLEFLDEYDPSLFEEAVPRVADLVLRMNKSRTAIVSEVPGGKPAGKSSKKPGGRAG